MTPTAATMPVTPAADDDEHRETAARIDRDSPAWLVLWGSYTRQFIAFPLFPSPPGTFITAYYPDALIARMHRASQQHGISPGKEHPHDTGT